MNRVEITLKPGQLFLTKKSILFFQNEIYRHITFPPNTVIIFLKKEKTSVNKLFIHYWLIGKTVYTVVNDTVHYSNIELLYGL